MSAQVEFFYDYVSSYSYLANSQVRDLFGTALVYRPMFLGAVMTATGNAPPAMVKARGRYLARDLERWAARYEIPFKPNPVFPQNTLGALRLVLVAEREGRFDTLHSLLFDAVWIHGRDLGEEAVLRELATDAGLDAQAALEASQAPVVKEQLKANTDEAVRRGAFGAPSFFVGDELFFGNDRMDFVLEALGRA